MNECQICRENHAPRSLSFDGKGINSCGMYRDRIATLQPSYAALGPLFAAAPDLLAALREVNIFMRIARQHFPKSIHDADRFALEQTCAAVGTAIAKAEGKS